MKQILAILLGGMLFAGSGAQTLPDSAVYNKGLRMIASSKTYQDFEAAGNYFDRLTNSKKDEWLAPLYSSLSFILASFREPDTKLKEELCNKAQTYINTSAMRHPDVSELASMQAFLYQARIGVTPRDRALKYSRKANSEIKKAKAANAGNPRAYFLYAMNVYYTPKIFGGGPKKALPLFEIASGKFDEFVPKMPFMPHWGKQQNLDMIAKCRKQ